MPRGHQHRRQFCLDLDLSDELPEHWQNFNAKFRPLWLEKNPGKSKIAAGLACGFIHTVCRGIIIAFEDDLKIRRALRAANNIDFYRYQVNFKLIRS